MCTMTMIILSFQGKALYIMILEMLMPVNIGHLEII